MNVLLGRSTKAILGGDTVTGVEFSDGSTLEADLVVVAAGIRPNVELGRKAGLTVNRGIVVNDFMETSDPDIFAVGECTEHNGICYGLVAPLFEQGKVLAATITGNKGPTYTGTVQAAKLKIMGVDVFSAGEWADGTGVEPVRYEDPRARRLQEARVARRQAGGRDSRRRRRRQPSLHGLAALGRRSDGAAASPPVSAAVGRRRTRCRGDGRERHRVRLRRRDQGRRSSARFTRTA